MIIQDKLDKIPELKKRRLSNAKIAEELGISKSTVGRHCPGKRRLLAGKAVKRLGLDRMFALTECSHCGLMYPAPNFLSKWLCPGCKTQTEWKSPSDTEKG